ncbi:MAG: hypothetical protein QGI51_03050 [Dehalococcoidales bacterium]|jgi:hypothetical protein|nr:hypothetical protein [Dehalococcoidales bacterium]
MPAEIHAQTLWGKKCGLAKPLKRLVGRTGIEPVTPGLKGRTHEFYNLLKINKLLKQQAFRLADFF